MFNHDELRLINKALLHYKSALQKNSQANSFVDQKSLKILNQILEKLEIELFEEMENNNTCDDCHSQICENGDIFIDIFIDSHSFKVDRSLVVCSDCYENKYKELYKDKQ